MNRYFQIMILAAFAILNLPLAYAATEIHGSVTAKHGDSLQVTFEPHKTAGPKRGDAVLFSKEIPGTGGMKAKAGEGTVTKVDGTTVWVKTDDNRPNLQMDAVIQATGSPATANSRQSFGKSEGNGAPYPVSPAMADDNGWGSGGQQMGREEALINGITSAHQACNYQRALQLAQQARNEIPANGWLQENMPTLEILARRSVNYRKALNEAYLLLEKGRINESIGQMKMAMQNASVPCGQDRQVLSLLDQAKLIARMEREEAIEKARMRSVANIGDNERYRKEIEKTRAQREAFGAALTGNLLGLLNAFSSGDTSQYPETQSHPDEDIVNELVNDTEKNNQEVLRKWRESQGWE